MIVEGQVVTYIGLSEGFTSTQAEVGVSGRVLAISGRNAHVQWSNGSVELVDCDDLVPGANQMATYSSTSEFDDTLDMPDQSLSRVRATYEANGEDGLISALDQAGRLATLGEYVEEAMTMLSYRIHHDPGLAPVLSQLDPEEAHSVLSRVARIAIADQMDGES